MDHYVATLDSPVGTWGIEGTDESVTQILLPNQHARRTRGSAPAAVRDAVAQLDEYFAGRRRDCDVPLAPVSATSFQRDVWARLCDIPYGEVRTYAEVAAATNRPRAMRAVGNANHANPWPILVPCHRVVAKAGIGGYGGGDKVKRYLLELEGVHYD